MNKRAYHLRHCALAGIRGSALLQQLPLQTRIVALHACDAGVAAFELLLQPLDAPGCAQSTVNITINSWGEQHVYVCTE